MRSGISSSSRATVDAVRYVDVLAIVPARGGSKRLPGKNKKLLAGKPLIEWTLEAARDAGVVELTVVSSDDDDILAIARNFGAVAIRRPAELASDCATSLDAVAHAVEFLMNQGVSAKRLLLLQPTSPLRNAHHIRAADRLMKERKSASVVSVCETEHSPLLANTLPDDWSTEGFIRPDIRGARSQDLPKFYRLNGAIYFVNTQEFLRTRRLDPDPGFAFVMEKGNSIDIDESIDFDLAEFLLSQR